MISITIVGAQNSGNLGAIARTMANFNISKLFLISPECEVLCGESKARSMHAYDLLKKAKIIHSFDDIDAVDYLVATSAKLGTGHSLRRVVLTPEMLSKQIDSKLHYSIVIGREDRGLLNTELERCDLLVNIPTSDKYPTMNISHALAIILYELSKSNVNVKFLAKKSDRNAVMIRLRDAAKHIENLENYEVIFENLMNRAFVRKKEARALAGFFKKIAKK